MLLTQCFFRGLNQSQQNIQEKGFPEELYSFDQPNN